VPYITNTHAWPPVGAPFRGPLDAWRGEEYPSTDIHGTMTDRYLPPPPPVSRAARQGIMLEALCTDTWAAALDRLAATSPAAASMLAHTCREKSPNHYKCTGHRDGMHEARGATGVLFERWPIRVALPPSNIDGLAELEADILSGKKFPNLGGEVWNWKTVSEPILITTLPPNPQATHAAHLAMQEAEQAALRVAQAARDQAARERMDLIVSMVNKGALKVTPQIRAKYSDAEIQAMYREAQAIIASGKKAPAEVVPTAAAWIDLLFSRTRLNGEYLMANMPGLGNAGSVFTPKEESLWRTLSQNERRAIIDAVRFRKKDAATIKNKPGAVIPVDSLAPEPRWTINPAMKKLMHEVFGDKSKPEKA
jgi:hypothetical protein